MTAKGAKGKLKVLICDDSAFSRVTLRKIVESDDSLRVIDIARNGREALEKCVKLKPDAVLMDVNMPVMDGMTALKELVAVSHAPVIMISSSSGENVSMTMDAIQAGAFDFIIKPDGLSHFENYATQILQKLKKGVTAGKDRGPALSRVLPGAMPSGTRPAGSKSRAGGLGFKAVALGISTGGPRSIFQVLPQLPEDLNAAVLVVQHMPTAFISTFTERLNKHTAMECLETEEGMPVKPGNIYVGRGGSHLRVVKKGHTVVIHQDPEPRHLFMPSVDIMMDSVCRLFGADTVGVLMTGMGRDGAEGMVNIVQAGGITIAESEETAVVFGMPQEAIKRGGAQIVAPNNHIASEIIKAVNKKNTRT